MNSSRKSSVIKETKDVAIIGSGISALCLATLLSRHSELCVTVHEKAAVFGGRARVESGVEHCQRLFIEDYSFLFDVLKRIKANDGRRLFDNLEEIDRYTFLKKRGWVRITHMYALLASELTLREKIVELKGAFSPPLLANQAERVNNNIFPKPKDFKFKSLWNALKNAMRSKKVYSLYGPTDTSLILPWINYLRQRGVKFKLNSKVDSCEINADCLLLKTCAEVSTTDVAVFTCYLTDTIEILERSNLKVSTCLATQLHCCCYTIQLDSSEEILRQNRNALYTRFGYFYFVQPKVNRCIVFCGRSPASTVKSIVIRDAREALGLKYEINCVGIAENKSLRDVIHVTNYVDKSVFPVGADTGVFFAGSYLENSYPVDSGEGAARTAQRAYGEILDALGLKCVED